MKKYLLILLLIFITGCATFSPSTTYVGNALLTEENIAKLKEGMTKQEILDIFGQPYNQTQFSSSNEIWTYTLTKSHFDGKRFTLNSRSLQITFSKDKVVSFTKTITQPILPTVTKTESH